MLNNFFSAKNIKILPEIILADQVILNIFSTHSFFLSQNPLNRRKLLKIYLVFKLSITLMMLIVPTFLSFSAQSFGGTIFH